MCCGYKTVRGGDDLPADAKSLKGCEQREGAIGEKTDVWHLQVFAQGILQLFVEFAVVGYPFCGPDFLQQLVEVVRVREQRRGDGDGRFVFHCQRGSIS